MNDYFNGFLNGLEKTAEKNINIDEGDYIVDGLLYCHKCDTAKQTRVNILGRERTPYCLCKCAAEEYYKERDEFEKQQKILKIEKARTVGFPDREMQNWRFEADDMANEKISLVAHRFVDNFEKMREDGKGLLLYGKVGTGKTFISACIANALIDKGYSCLVTNFSRLTNTIQGMYAGKQEYLDSLNQFSLLVIDDLASERDTEFMGEIVQSIIDARCRSGLPIIITTNLTGDDLKNPADIRKQRIYSRLFEMCIPVEVIGKDRRREKLKADFSEYNDILGL